MKRKFYMPRTPQFRSGILKSGTEVDLFRKESKPAVKLRLGRTTKETVIIKKMVSIDPQILTVAQIKNVLRQHGLSIYGRKTELMLRMQAVDLTGSWVKAAAQHGDVEDNEEDEARGIQSDIHNERCRERKEESVTRREMDFVVRKRNLMQREIELLKHENETLRMSPQLNTLSVASHATINIKNVGELLNEYNGSGDFERWRAQVNLVCEMYELDVNAAKILVGSKLRGKALDWYRSRAEYLSISLHLSISLLDELFKKMECLINR